MSAQPSTSVRSWSITATALPASMALRPLIVVVMGRSSNFTRAAAMPLWGSAGSAQITLPLCILPVPLSHTDSPW